MESIDLASQKGIILYDYFAAIGGAERLIMTLAQAPDDTDLCVGYRDTVEIAESEMKLLCYTLSTKTNMPAWRTVKLMRAFASKTNFLSGYEWVLFSGTVAPFAVKNHPEGRNLLYCHTIPRFAYDLKEYYLNLIPKWQQPLLKGLIRYMTPRYEAAVSKMDRIMVNSENVRKRLKTYLGLDSQVIYPPCETGRFKWLGRDGYYLSTARLENFKRVEMIVRAFLRMPNQKLIVASGGSELNRLMHLAQDASNITFTGWVSEEKLRTLMGKAIASIYVPIDEDFGISPVESMAAGKPVIGVREGGLLETVIHGETGLLIPPDPSEDDLIEAVREMKAKTALGMKSACEARALLFTKEIFVDKMSAALK